MPARHRASEGGAIVVVVVIALFMFTLMSAFVVDYGLQLVSHNQIQTAVDAAALAGATALAFDGHPEDSRTATAVEVATEFTRQNQMWDGQALKTALSFPLCPKDPDTGAIGQPSNGCVEITASRDDSNPIPAMLGALLGFSSYTTTATAKAEAKLANATDCLRPIAIPDRWDESPVAPWEPPATYDRYRLDPITHTAIFDPKDSYTPPNRRESGTSLTNDDQFGKFVTLKPGTLDTPIATISPWAYLPLQMNAKTLRENTVDCARTAVSIGGTVPIMPGAVATNATDIASGLNELIAADPDARWDEDLRRVVDSCAEAGCRSMSPRIIAIALYDPQSLADESTDGLPLRIFVRSFVGLFVDEVVGTDEIHGYITRHPGLRDLSKTFLTDESSFLRATALVQ